MKIPRNLAKLTELFQKCGAPDPQSWASSQINEGIPQLQRYLFLRQAWKQVVQDGDDGWIGRYIEAHKQDPRGPYADVGRVLHACVDKGIAPADLTALARGLQAELLFSLCYMLDDPGTPEPELQDLQWGLFEVDEDGNPALPRISGLHESVLHTDPTGREMCPKEPKP